jgi:hypothetical protein
VKITILVESHEVPSASLEREDDRRFVQVTGHYAPLYCYSQQGEVERGACLSARGNLPETLEI